MIEDKEIVAPEAAPHDLRDGETLLHHFAKVPATAAGEHCAMLATAPVTAIAQ